VLWLVADMASHLAERDFSLGALLAYPGQRRERHRRGRQGAAQPGLAALNLCPEPLLLGAFEQGKAAHIAKVVGCRIVFESVATGALWRTIWRNSKDAVACVSFVTRRICEI